MNIFFYVIKAGTPMCYCQKGCSLRGKGYGQVWTKNGMAGQAVHKRSTKHLLEQVGVDPQRGIFFLNNFSNIVILTLTSQGSSCQTSCYAYSKKDLPACISDIEQTWKKQLTVAICNIILKYLNMYAQHYTRQQNLHCPDNISLFWAVNDLNIQWN